MPTVPYQPYPTEKPAEGGPGPLRVDTPAAAFGGAVGHALEGLGKEIGHAGDELFRRALALQQLQNETDATNAKTEFMTRAGTIREQFGTLEGRNASAALPKLQTDLATERLRIRESLPNDAARRMYDGESLGVMGRVNFSAAGHAAQQTKSANDQSIDASINSKMTDIYNNGYYPGWEKDLKTLMDQKAGIKGWDPETEEKNFRVLTSTAKSHYITGLAQREPMKAEAEYDKIKGTLSPNDDLRVQNTLTTAIRTTASRVLAQKEVDKDSTEPIEVRRERVVQEAEEAHKNDPQIGWYAGNAFDRLINKQQAQHRQEHIQAKQTVDQALSKGQFTSPEALTASDPKVKAAWDKLGATEQKPYLSVMKTLASGDHWPTPETDAKVHELMGLAHSDPGKFLNMSIPEVMEGKLPRKDQNKLIELQQRTQVAAEKDPRLTHALQVLGGDMLKEHVFKSQSPEKFYQFQGALHSAIQQFQEEHKKPPNDKEITELGKRLLQRVTVPRQSFMGFGVSQPGELFGMKSTQDLGRLFEQGQLASSKDIEKIQDQIAGDTGTRPTKYQVQQMITSRLYKELYQGKSEVAGGQ